MWPWAAPADRGGTSSARGAAGTRRWDFEVPTGAVSWDAGGRGGLVPGGRVGQDHALQDEDEAGFSGVVRSAE